MSSVGGEVAFKSVYAAKRKEKVGVAMVLENR